MIADGPLQLSHVLLFWTGLPNKPPLGFPYGKLQLDYHPHGERYVMPKSAACFGRLALPTVHQDKDTFFNKMDNGIGNSLCYFGLL